MVALDQRVSSYDGVTIYPVITVRRDDGTTAAFHAYHAIPKAELAKQAPQIGERIGIRYIGRPAGKSYEAYRVIVDRDASGIDWPKMEADAASELKGRGDDIPF